MHASVVDKINRHCGAAIYRDKGALQPLPGSDHHRQTVNAQLGRAITTLEAAHRHGLVE